MEHFTKEEIKKYRDIFALYDKCKKGTISLKDVGECIRVFGQNPTDALIKQYTRNFLPDERVSFDDTVTLFYEISKHCPTYTPADFVSGLQLLHPNPNGHLLANDVRRLLKHGNEKLTNNEINEVFRSTGSDDNNDIDCEEFVRKLMNG